MTPGPTPDRKCGIVSVLQTRLSGRETTSDLTSLVRQAAKEYGFDAVGIARADLPLTDDFERYQQFVAGGMHGEMAYLAENAEARRRLDSPMMLEGAKSVICLARKYRRRDEDDDGAFAKTIARYARGRDYHNHVRRKLRQLAGFVRRLGSEEHPVEARPLCDDAPMLERAWAARAGLGFVGKNGLLIVPGQGSFVLLGEVITTLALIADEPMNERCGSCTRCLDACPTDAFAAPWILDARKCIAYLTIEHRSAMPAALEAGVGEHLFGCDDCQTVCPFNAGQNTRTDAGPFSPHQKWDDVGVEDLLTMSDDMLTELAASSPLTRARAEGLRRNALVVMKNRRR